MKMLNKYLDLIPSLKQVHIDALLKYAIYGQPLPVRGILDTWTVRDLLWNDNLISISQLELKHTEAEKAVEALAAKTSKYDLKPVGETENEASVKKAEENSQSILNIPVMGLKIVFTWSEAADALFAVIMIRKYHVAAKVSEAKMKAAEAKVIAQIEKLQDKVADSDPKAALEAALIQLAKMKGTYKELEVVAPVIKEKDLI